MAENPRQKMIIDVDTGTDDAEAIMLALSSPCVQVLAITCVAGNVDLEQVCRNTLRTLKLCDRLQVPVYRGADRPLLIEDEEKHARQYHGNDGFGDVPHLEPFAPDIGLIQSENAVHSLLRLTKENPGEITLVALAPLTNIALALKLDPEFGDRLKKTVIMGGNIEGKGNVTTSAEFNFHCDPEAAYIVLRELTCPVIHMVTWECCHNNCLSWEWYDKWITAGTPKTKFIVGVIAKVVNVLQNKLKIHGYRSCDPQAMAVAIDDTLILESKTVHCSIELQGKLTRGQMVVDWTNRLQVAPNVTVVTKLDLNRYGGLMEAMLL